MEKTNFVKILGDSPKIKILDMLITGRELDYSISDIASAAGIGRTTFYRLLDGMLKEKILVTTRKLGHIQLYRLNEKNSNVKNIIEFYDNLNKTLLTKV